MSLLNIFIEKLRVDGGSIDLARLGIQFSLKCTDMLVKFSTLQ
jgi:hypothetical protein